MEWPGNWSSELGITWFNFGIFTNTENEVRIPKQKREALRPGSPRRPRSVCVTGTDSKGARLPVAFWSNSPFKTWGTHIAQDTCGQQRWKYHPNYWNHLSVYDGGSLKTHFSNHKSKHQKPWWRRQSRLQKLENRERNTTLGSKWRARWWEENGFPCLRTSNLISRPVSPCIRRAERGKRHTKCKGAILSVVRRIPIELCVWDPQFESYARYLRNAVKINRVLLRLLRASLNP